AGDDLFDLSRVDDNNIDVEIHGGDGNDTIKGPKHAKSVKLFGDAGNDNITGGDGPDLIDGGVGDDTIAGGAGHDTITGGEGADQIDGGTGDDVIDGGTGDDQISGGGGSDTYLGASAGSLVTIDGPTSTLDFSGRPENLSIIVQRNAGAGKAQILV